MKCSHTSSSSNGSQRQRRLLTVLDGPLEEFAIKEASFWKASNRELFKNIGIGAVTTLFFSWAIGQLTKLGGSKSPALPDGADATAFDPSTFDPSANETTPEPTAVPAAKRSHPFQEQDVSPDSDDIDELQNSLVQLYYTHPEIFDDEDVS